MSRLPRTTCNHKTGSIMLIMAAATPPHAYLRHHHSNRYLRAGKFQYRYLLKFMVHRSRNKVLQNDMQITANCTIRSCVYGHILVLNLHSTCAAHLGKISLLFWFITYLFNSPFFFVLLDFSLYIRYLLSVSL